MAIEAPLSKFKKNSFKIYIVFCLISMVILAYDGYLSKYEWSHRRSFYDKHVKDGRPDDTMMFNRIAPIGLLITAGILLWRFQITRDKKLRADEKELIIDDKKKIPYDSIRKIDKTHFDSKGYFIITYTDEHSGEVNRKLSDKKYDNLSAVLDHLVAKIS